MLSIEKFVIQSLELNLFFIRIMKEHSIFLEAGFTPKNPDLAARADEFKNIFTELLSETIILSRGIISRDAINSNEIVTSFTLNAEQATEYYTNIVIDANITNEEILLTGESGTIDYMTLELSVADLNQRIMGALSQLIDFKTELLQNVLNCSIFTVNYPLLIDHILREARLYFDLLEKLQNRVKFNLYKEVARQESFWNRIMAEHAKFIRGLLDPTEETLIETAHKFGKEFDELTKQSLKLNDHVSELKTLTKKALDETKDIRDFKRQGTEGLLNCQIRSIILPLLGDHTLREANHYLRLLKYFKKEL